jgi:hypothetical protein
MLQPVTWLDYYCVPSASALQETAFCSRKLFKSCVSCGSWCAVRQKLKLPLWLTDYALLHEDVLEKLTDPRILDLDTSLR